MRLVVRRFAPLVTTLALVGCAPAVRAPRRIPVPPPAAEPVRVELFADHPASSTTLTAPVALDLETAEGHRFEVAESKPIEMIAANESVSVTQPGSAIAFSTKRLQIAARSQDAPLALTTGANRALVTQGPLKVTAVERALRVVADVPLDAYVAGVVAAEMPARQAGLDGAEAALRAQAILSRTFALVNRGRHHDQGFDLCAGTHCQMFAGVPPRASAEAWRAARETSGQVVTYGTGLAWVFFHASCGGSTSAIDKVWGGPALPYLQGVPDPFDPHRAWRSTVPRARLLEALQRDPGTNPGSMLHDVRVVAKDRAGRATAIAIDGSRRVVVRGADFRLIVGRALGEAMLPSLLMAVTRRGDGFEFHGRGAGHGIGLCQMGALEMARHGASTDQILGLFYPGTRIRSVTSDK